MQEKKPMLAIAEALCAATDRRFNATSNWRSFPLPAAAWPKDFGAGALGNAGEIALLPARELPIQFCPPALGLFPQAFGGGASRFPLMLQGRLFLGSKGLGGLLGWTCRGFGSPFGHGSVLVA